MSYKIICDENIAYAQEAFSTLGEVTLCHGRTIDNSLLRDKDFLIVRSITQINKKLLEETAVKFVGTATIGKDHVDEQYLQDNSIGFSDAKGCNADAVAEFVLSAITRVFAERNMLFNGSTIGIIGHGNIGTRIEKLSKVVGLTPVINDPPKQRTNPQFNYVSLAEAFACDIVTFHTPLEYGTDFPTYHLLNANNAGFVKKNALIINAARGEVADTKTLIKLKDEKNPTLIIDVWENEPAVNKQLLEKVKFASPHVAGYSNRGKANGTAIVYNNLCGFLGIAPLWHPNFPIPENPVIPSNSDDLTPDSLYFYTKQFDHLDIDTTAMKKISAMSEAEGSIYFDNLRKHYNLRFEFRDYYSSKKTLHNLGFKTPPVQEHDFTESKG